MAFLEADRVQIRIYVGYSATFLQADPRLESAITYCQSTSDGGSRPDNSTELAIRQVIAQLQSVDQQITNLQPLYGALGVGTIKIDVARQNAMLRKDGRALVHRLCRFFDVAPYSDIFGSAPDDILPSPGYEASPFNNRTPY